MTILIENNKKACCLKASLITNSNSIIVAVVVEGYKIAPLCQSCLSLVKPTDRGEKKNRQAVRHKRISRFENYLFQRQWTSAHVSWFFFRYKTDINMPSYKTMTLVLVINKSFKA